MALAGKVCLVTGASRGIGKGIALQLGQAKATVYITGRTLKPKPESPGLSLEEVALEIEERGGKCIPVVCDHSNDVEVAKLFDTISKENDGRLDLLVNNAYAAVNVLMDPISKGGGKFYDKESPAEHWDTVNNVGLRNHYICTTYAAKMMIPRKQGLIVNISSFGGLRYLFDVAYGVGKCALDRMAVDCGIELKRHKVACISLWPGPVQTELVNQNLSKMDSRIKQSFEEGESTEFTGKAIVELAKDSNIMKKSSRILIVADLASEYGFTDNNGVQPSSVRWLGNIFKLAELNWVGKYIPGWMKVPYFFLHMASNKF